MEELKDPPLHLRVEIDQQVSANDEVHIDEGRILDQILGGKDEHLAHVPAEPVQVAVLDKKTLQPLPGDIGGNPFAVGPLSGRFDGAGVQVGGKNLDLDFFLRFFHGLDEHHGHRVRLFSRGAARHPDPERLFVPRRPDEVGKRLIGQCLECLRVTEETRHADQQLREEPVQLVGILPEIADVLARVMDLENVHPAGDPTMDRVHLVAGQVVARLLPQQEQNLLKGLSADRRGHVRPGGNQILLRSG